jgi:hypothetical protein
MWTLERPVTVARRGDVLYSGDEKRFHALSKTAPKTPLRIRTPPMLCGTFQAWKRNSTNK